MATVKQLLAKIQKTHDQRTATVKLIRKEQAALKKAGISYGSASYKQGKYMRIVKPSRDGEKRVFDYVGADRVKQKTALDALERGRQYDDIEDRVKAVQSSLATLEATLLNVIQELEWSHSLAIDKKYL